MHSILFLAADPTEASRLRVGEELREIQERLQLAKLRDLFTLNQRMSVRPADLSQALLDLKPEVVHFSGHGMSTGALCFEDETAKTHPIHPDGLADLFEQFTDHIKCVILNACYSESQAKAIVKHIDYVVGMNQAIGDKAAIAFAIGFYQALGAGRSIEDAFKLGCVQIKLQGINENLTPVLTKKDNARVFQVGGPDILTNQDDSETISSGNPSTPVPSDSLTNDDPPGRLQRVLDLPADTVFSIYNLIWRPIKIVLSRLSDDNDTRRFRRAFNFFVAMFAVYCVIELILLYHRGISSNIGVVLLFFLLELIAYLFVLFVFAVILHVFLRIFRVPSDFLHKTLPCFFYYAAIVIPIYAILSYFPDLVEYNVVDKAGSGILLHLGELSRMTDELLREWGTASERAHSVFSLLVDIWSLVGLVFLAKVLSKFYQRRFLPCFLAGFFALVIITLIETFGVKFVSAKLQEVFIKGRQDVTKVATPQPGNWL